MALKGSKRIVGCASTNFLTNASASQAESAVLGFSQVKHLFKRAASAFIHPLKTMIDSIYYTSNLVPVPVEVVERSGLLATVKTQANKIFKVPEHRIIPLKSTASIGTGIIRTKPAGYLCIYEFLWNNDIRDLSQEEASLISKRAGWACRKAEIKSWRGKHNVAYYPAKIIESCYQKFINAKNS